MIEVKNIHFTYTPDGPFSYKALNNISFIIPDGEFVGIIGHTGSGKSTLIQLLNGLLKPSSGSIVIDGENICEKSYNLQKLRQKVGIVFQYPEHQLFEETVMADISFGPKNIGLNPEEVKNCVYDAMKLVGLDENVLNKSPFELSGGQKRRVAIAGVLAMKPEILILDEPTAGLDPKGREELLTQLKSLHKSQGITVILVSHSMEDIANNATMVLVLNNASLAMQGTPSEIFCRGDELEKMGLNVPQITKLIKRLIEKGINIRPDIYTMNFAKEEIMKLFKERCRK